MIRRFLRWICRHEIADACAPLLIEKVTAELRHQINEQTQYLNGYQRGVEDAYAAMEKEVRERMGGASDVLTAEDIAKARKGQVH